MMKTRTVAIVEGFEELRQLCDPRGHALLDALERLCVTEAALLNGVVAELERTPQPANVIPLLRDHGGAA